jgi:hypothetical protein
LVVEDGFTDKIAFVEPVFHKYVFAPLAVNVALLPTQITVLLGEMPTTGKALTETICTAVLEQPVKAEVPVTV